MTRTSNESGAIMAGIVTVCALGCASALWPPLEHAMNALAVGVLVLAAVGAALRILARRLRWWIEDRADRVICRELMAARDRERQRVLPLRSS